MSGAAVNRVIRADDGTVRSWPLPEMEDTSGLPGTGRPPTAKELEALFAQAREAGHAEGYAAGFALGQAEGAAEAEARLEEQAGHLVAAIAQVAEPLKVVDREVEESLSRLAFAVARQIVRRELKSSPGEVIGAVREGLALLPIGARQTRVHLHPDDVDVVRQVLGGDEEAFTLKPDPSMSRGGCLIETDQSFIDATVEARLSAVIAQALGGERQDDDDA